MIFEWIRKGKKKNSKITTVSERSGWTYNEAKNAMNRVKKEQSISYGSYLKYDLWQYPQEDLPVIFRAKEVLERKKKKVIAKLISLTDWTEEQAKEQLEDTVEKLGISYEDYIDTELYKYPIEEQENAYNKAVMRKERGKTNYKRPISEFEHWVKMIMERTGWERDVVEEKIKDANRRTCCSAKEYFLFRFDEISEQEQENYFVKRASVSLLSKYDKSPILKRILLNKELTNLYFSNMVKRPWCVNKRVSYEQFVELFQNVPKVIYKPGCGSKGRGIKIYELDSEHLKECYDEIVSFSRGIVEECLVQHPDISKLAPSSVNTIRVVTISNKGNDEMDESGFSDVVYARLRIGGGDSIVDNFSSGGMVAGIDMETGIVVTPGTDMMGNIYQKHPKTGIDIKGFKIPQFERVIELVKEGCKKSLVSGYIGWDIAICEDGPQLIEANGIPGNCVCQVPFAAEHQGLMPLMEKYLKDTRYDKLMKERN